jgi:hypothetical protein
MPLRPGRAAALLLAGAVWASGPCAAQARNEVLRSEFWADVEPVAGVGEEWPVGPGEARRRILDEAAWVFGGMIWGYEFSYTPYDRTRALAERFDVAPIQSLEPGELLLAPEASPPPASPTRPDSLDRFYFLAQYRPDPGLVSLMDSYSSDPWKGAQGIGKADMDGGVKGRRAAYIDGLRLSVRSLLQSLEPNKPRLVKGRVVFERPPPMAIIGGFYTVQVRARVMVTEVIPYKVY